MKIREGGGGSGSFEHWALGGHFAYCLSPTKVSVEERLSAIAAVAPKLDILVVRLGWNISHLNCLNKLEGIGTVRGGVLI